MNKLKLFLISVLLSITMSFPVMAELYTTDPYWGGVQAMARDKDYGEYQNVNSLNIWMYSRGESGPFQYSHDNRVQGVPHYSGTLHFSSTLGSNTLMVPIYSTFKDNFKDGYYHINVNGDYYHDSNTWGRWQPDTRVWTQSVTVPAGTVLIWQLPKTSNYCTLTDNKGRMVLANASGNDNYRNEKHSQYAVVATPQMSGQWVLRRGSSYSHNNDADSDWEHAVQGACDMVLNLNVQCINHNGVLQKDSWNHWWHCNSCGLNYGTAPHSSNTWRYDANNLGVFPFAKRLTDSYERST